MEPEDLESSDETVVDQIRTRRLAIVDAGGVEHAVVEVANRVIEFRLGGARSGMPCEIMISVGEHEPGLFVASVDLWAHGDSVGGASVIVQGSRVEFLRVP